MIHCKPLMLLTDLYQLTMAYGYWKTGTAEREAVYQLFFRANPFGGGYTIAAGLSSSDQCQIDESLMDLFNNRLNNRDRNNGRGRWHRRNFDWCCFWRYIIGQFQDNTNGHFVRAIGEYRGIQCDDILP